MIDRNVVSEITPLELQAWKGPVNWNTHHDVLKDSATTPVRLVSNSSFTNGSTTLNNLLVKGPNTLNCLFTNLVRFRGYEITLVGDMSKAYNTIDHFTLPTKLEYYGIRGDALDIFTSYLTNRKQFVEIDTKWSRLRKSLDCSIIQGK